MSKVVRMLEGDGLVEKWEASKNKADTPKFSPLSSSFEPQPMSTTKKVCICNAYLQRIMRCRIYLQRTLRCRFSDAKNRVADFLQRRSTLRCRNLQRIGRCRLEG